jgi:hypothetical protein
MDNNDNGAFTCMATVRSHPYNNAPIADGHAISNLTFLNT